MNTAQRILFATALVGALAFTNITASAQTEPLGGQPPLGSKPSVKNLEEQVTYQRAFEAVVWSQPAIGIYGIRKGMLDGLGMKDNEVLAMSKPLTTRHEFLTANNSTPYITANADLRNAVFTGATLTGVQLDGANVEGTQLPGQ